MINGLPHERKAILLHSFKYLQVILRQSLTECFSLCTASTNLRTHQSFGRAEKARCGAPLHSL